MEAYLDNSSTTPPFLEVLNYLHHLQLNNYGNPSSLHSKGVQAEKEMEKARKSLSAMLRCSPSEIIFTSGGTESNNLAIKGIAKRHQRYGNHLVSTPIEHPSSLKALKQLEKEGFRISYVPVDEKGLIDRAALLNSIDSSTTLVTLIYVNNEIGTVQDLAHIVNDIKSTFPHVLVHVDGVQSLGKFDIFPRELGIDALSLSAHKIHGPKGIGTLWLKQGTKIFSLFHGGDQEKGLRPGTENVPGIVGFGKAVSQYMDRFYRQSDFLYKLKSDFVGKITEQVEATINGPTLDEGAPHILNLSFPGLKSEVLVRSLADQGVFASPGSACHSRNPQPSHVLTALGLNRERIEGAVRFSFSVLNTSDEIEYAATKVISCVKELRQLMV